LISAATRVRVIAARPPIARGDRTADALLLRPGLATALKQAKLKHCPLLVSALDRLSRNVHFITGLMEHRVHFVVAAPGKDGDDFTLHIYASLAEQERKMISERCRAASMVQKFGGRKFGLARKSKAWQRKVSARGRAIWIAISNERAEAYRPHIEWVLRQKGANGSPISFKAAADKLNERNIKSMKNVEWSGQQVKRTALRFGLHHPPGYMKCDLVRARIQAIWKEHPDATAAQVRASPLWERPLSVSRSYRFLHECRTKAAARSPVQRRIGWHVDRWTSARIQIAKIMKRSPGVVGKQVLAEIKTDLPSI
jgi:hypothetical protein